MATVDIEPQPTTSSPLPRPRSTAPWQALDRRPWLCRLFLAVWCGVLFFYGIHVGQFWKTESLRAIIAAEYLRTGNWIVPVLYGEPLFTKPPGMYAAIALCSLPFGAVTEWTARLPSAFAAATTVLILCGYFSRCFGRLGGLVVAVIVPMSPLWLDKATAAEIDMMQVMWVTGAIVCFLRALEGEEFKARVAPRTPWLWWIAALLCVAGGVLTKWTSPAFFYGTAIPLLWCRGRLGLLFSRQHLVAAAVGASLCLAWASAAVAIEGWDVFVGTVKREAFQRMVPDYAPYHDPWYVFALHPLRIWYTNLPWSLVALVACWPGFGQLWNWRARMLWQALHCWIWPNLLIWSLVLDHKARHSFPLFPAIGGLAAMVWIAWLTAKLPWTWRVRPQPLLLTAMICWLVAKLIWIHGVIPNRELQRDPKGKAAVVAGLVPAGCVLYLFHLKDEGIMFYYGRPVRRLSNPADLPSSSEPLYCILADNEWRRWSELSSRPMTPLTTGMTDEQGAPMWLVRVGP